jgi:SAM-dependent methyltransferase
MLRYHLDDSTELASRNSTFINRSVDWILERFAVSKGTRICDLGCGPGLYSTRLTRSGALVTGIDFSDNSIRYARETARDEGLAINYLHDNYLEHLPGGPFDLVVMIYCDFCVLSPQQRNVLLNRIREILGPAGAFFLDVCSMRLYESTEEVSSLEDHPDGGFWSSVPHFALNKSFLYPDARLILHKHTIIEEGRTREIFNWLQCYDLESLRVEFAMAGFDIAEHLSNVAGDPWQSESHEIAVIAKRTAQSPSNSAASRKAIRSSFTDNMD